MFEIFKSLIWRDKETIPTPKYISDIELNRLRIEGRKLVERKQRREPSLEIPLSLWLATVSTELENALGEKSSLVTSFKAYVKTVSGDISSQLNPPSQKTLEDTDSVAEKPIKYDKKVFEDIVSHTNLYLNHASDILLKIKADQELGYQFEKYIGEKFTRSLWFWVPIGCLFAALAWALIGSIQLYNTKVDLVSLVATAQQRAYQDISTQVGFIQNDFNKLASADAGKINDAAGMIQSKLDTEANDISGKLAGTAGAIQNNLSNQANEMSGKITATAGAVQNNLNNQANEISSKITITAGAIQNNLDNQANEAIGKITRTYGAIQNDLNIQATEVAEITSEAPATVAAFPNAIATIESELIPLKQNVEELTTRMEPIQVAATTVAQAQGGGILIEVSNLVVAHSALQFVLVIISIILFLTTLIVILIKARKA